MNWITDALSQPIDQVIASFSLQAVYIAAIVLGVLILTAMIIKFSSESTKRVLFWSITAVIAITTGALVGMTIYLNTISVTKGPVHWHADFEIWACGQEQDLKDPAGISNKIGTPTLHEHDDWRIHVEGVVVDYPDVTLGSFFRVIGGQMTGKSLTIPTIAGLKNFINGQDCAATGPAQLQVFLIKADLQAKTYSQQKLASPADYQFTQDSRVPPGDCLIIEFGAVKERTDKLCQSYEVAKETGDLTTEVLPQEDNGH